MRYGWLAAAVAALSLWPVNVAVGQEGPGRIGRRIETGRIGRSATRTVAPRLRMGNVARLELGDQTIAVSYGDTPTDGPDYAALESIEDGGFVHAHRKHRDQTRRPIWI